MHWQPRCVTTPFTFADQKKESGIEKAQIPKWSADDMNFFLHGSMSTEVVPEPVLQAFIKIYPDLFPREDLANLGLIPDSEFGWPIGFSRKEVKHLGNLPAVGLNCAACHVAEIHSSKSATPVRVLGVTSHFDAEAFFGAVIVATFRTADPANMKRFASAYLAAMDPDVDESTQTLLAEEWEKQKEKIDAEIKSDPAGAKGVEPGALQEIAPGALVLDDEILEHGKDLAAFAHSILQLFHNMRAALHIPDQPPDKAPPLFRPRPERCLRSSFRRTFQRAATLRAGKIRIGLEREQTALGSLGWQHPVAARTKSAGLARPGRAAKRKAWRARFREW